MIFDDLMTFDDLTVKLSRQMILIMSGIEDLNSIEDTDKLFGETPLHLKRSLKEIDIAVSGILDGSDHIFVTSNSYYGLTKSELKNLNLSIDIPAFSSSILKRKNRPNEEEAEEIIKNNIAEKLKTERAQTVIFKTFTIDTSFSDHLTFFLLIASSDNSLMTNQLAQNTFSLTVDTFTRTLCGILLKNDGTLPDFSNSLAEIMKNLPNDFEKSLSIFANFLKDYLWANESFVIYRKEDKYCCAQNFDSPQIITDDSDYLLRLLDGTPNPYIDIFIDERSVFLHNLMKDKNSGYATIFSVPSTENSVYALIILLFDNDPKIKTNNKLFIDSQLRILSKGLECFLSIADLKAKALRSQFLKTEQIKFHNIF